MFCIKSFKAQRHKRDEPNLSITVTLVALSSSEGVFIVECDTGPVPAGGAALACRGERGGGARGGGRRAEGMRRFRIGRNECV